MSLFRKLTLKTAGDTCEIDCADSGSAGIQLDFSGAGPAVTFYGYTGKGSDPVQIKAKDINGLDIVTMINSGSVIVDTSGFSSIAVVLSTAALNKIVEITYSLSRGNPDNFNNASFMEAALTLFKQINEYTEATAIALSKPSIASNVAYANYLHAKAFPCNVHSITAFNKSAASIYLYLLDINAMATGTLAVPANTTTIPTFPPLLVAAHSSEVFTWPLPLKHSNGVFVIGSSTEASLTAVTASDLWLSVQHSPS